MKDLKSDWFLILFLVGISFAFNPYVFERFFTLDETIRPFCARLALILLQLSFIGAGLLAICKRRAAILWLVKRLVLFFLSTGIVLALAEMGLRIGIGSRSRLGDYLRRPELYTVINSETWWKLNYIWHKGHFLHARARKGIPEKSHFRFHPRLGWDFRPGAQTSFNTVNSLGLISNREYFPEDFIQPIVLCGDSFVAAGHIPMKDKLNTQLENLLKKSGQQRTVINLGVGGYGLGQIWLRLQEFAPLFQEPVLVIGIYPDDLNRTIMDFRSRPKPYFGMDGERLRLMGTPIENGGDSKSYIAEHPPLKSYAINIVLAKMPVNQNRFRERVKRVNSELICRFVNLRENYASNICFLLFRNRIESGQDECIVYFVKEQARKHNVECIDLKEIFLEEAWRRGSSLDQYYILEGPGKNHLSSLGYAKAAEVLYLWILKDMDEA